MKYLLSHDKRTLTWNILHIQFLSLTSRNIQVSGLHTKILISGPTFSLQPQTFPRPSSRQITWAAPGRPRSCPPGSPRGRECEPAGQQISRILCQSDFDQIFSSLIIISRIYLTYPVTANLSPSRNLTSSQRRYPLLSLCLTSLRLWDPICRIRLIVSLSDWALQTYRRIFQSQTR